MFEFITQHQSWAALSIYWIFSAAVSSMPEPVSINNSGYLWLYRFCHTMAGNLTTAFGNKLPDFRKLVLLLTIPPLLSATACGAHYTVHPGAVNMADSGAYDTLLIAEAAINQARIESQTQPLSPALTEALNTVIRSYNVTRLSWLTYRGAVGANMASDAYFSDLTTNLTQLTDAIQALKEVQ